MRIAYFSDNFYPEISGISDSIITTGEELRKRGHEVVYIAPWYPQKSYHASRDATRDALTIKRLPSIAFINSPTGYSRIALPLGTSIPFLRKFKPDILHVQSPYGCGLEAWLASKIVGVPLIGTNHTPLEEFMRYLPGGKLYTPMALAYNSWFYNRPAFVSTPYQELIDDMRRAGLRQEARALANPVHFSSLPKDANQKRACKREFGIEGPLMLSSGRLAPEKHVDIVINAFALLLKDVPNARLVITGHGSNEALLKTLAAELGIDSHVHFVGFVTQSELERLYCAADVYTVMSTAEAQSLSLMQAFANGVPAVSARSRGLIDYTPPTCGFLVEPGDIEALAARLKQLIRDPALREEMGAAGMVFVQQFTPEKIADEWERIYAKVCGSA
jgi:glycosyltransferase involved in cell wall biosynthesis